MHHTASRATAPARDPRRAHFRAILLAFLGLGVQVGAQAVLLADLDRARDLSLAALGLAFSAQAGVGIVALLVGGALADRLGRRPLLALGSGGLGLFFLALATVPPYDLLIAAFILGGASASAYDLAVNTLGGDYERRHRARAMTALHAGFSGGAALGTALSALLLARGTDFRLVYALLGALLLTLALGTRWLPLPATDTPPPDDERPDDVAPTAARVPGACVLLRTPGVLLAAALVGVCFFGDGALEGFTGVYLRNLLGAGPLLGGLGIAAFHLVGLIARLLSGAALRRHGERRVITIAGLGAACGVALALATTVPAIAVAGLLIVGFSLAPVVPVAFSLAGRAAPGHGARGRARHHGRLQRLHRRAVHRRRRRGSHLAPRRAPPLDRHHARHRPAGPAHRRPIPAACAPISPVRMTPAPVRNRPSGRFGRGTASLQ